MYAQLGTVIFDGLKSFVSFNDEQEAIIAEHPLINSKPKLQRSGSGLRKASISLYLHQEFCNVEDEKNKLNEYLNSSEILPLLWGNGKVEGEFVIQSINRTVNDQDKLGNILGCTISISLIEAVITDRLEKQQQAAKQNGFAVGNKKPAINSTRKNPSTCSKSVADNLQAIKANGKQVDDIIRSYSGTGLEKASTNVTLDKIIGYAGNLITIADTPDSCASGVANFKGAALNVKSKASFLKTSVGTNAGTIKTDNDSLQVAIRTLSSAATPIAQNAITRK